MNRPLVFDLCSTDELSPYVLLRERALRFFTIEN